MTFTLVQSDIDAYKNDGAVLLKNVISRKWLDRVAGAIERDILDPGPFCHSYEPEDGQGRFHGNLRTWQNDPEFHAYCFETDLPKIAAQLFNTDRVNLLYDQIFVKEPGTANRTRWHNDQPYWPVSGQDVVSFWLALDQTTEENGRLEFVRGSHKWDRWFQPENFGEVKKGADGSGYEENPDYEKMPDIEATREEYDIIAWDMDPGDVIAFHGMTVHGAGGNYRDDIRRRGYTVRYTGADAWYDPRPGTAQPLVSPDLKNGDPMNNDLFPVVWTHRI